MRSTNNATKRTAMGYTLRQAATATGKDKSTIHRAIKTGRISASIDDTGSYSIDPVELHRVFPPVARDGAPLSALGHGETGHETAETAVLRELIRQIESERDDLRRRLDAESVAREKAADDVRRLTMMLTHQPQPKRDSQAVRPWLWVLLAGVVVGALVWAGWLR